MAIIQVGPPTSTGQWRGPQGQTDPEAIRALLRHIEPVSASVTDRGAAQGDGGTGLYVAVLAPGAPTNLRTLTVSTSAVQLAWDAPSSGGDVSSYELLRGGVVIQQGIGGLSATDSNVTSGQGYSYTVRAVGPGGVGPESSALPVEVPEPGEVEPFYETDFEEFSIGDFGGSGGGNPNFNWSNGRGTTISTAESLTGTRSLAFPYTIVPRQWCEQRFNHKPMQGYWVEYYTHVPSNYYQNTPGQLKFYTFWNEQNGYSGQGAGTFQAWPQQGGSSTINMAGYDRDNHQHYTRTSYFPNGSTISGPLFGAHNRGQWHRIRIQIRWSDFGGSESNGITRFWLNDDLLFSLDYHPFGAVAGPAAPGGNFATNGYLYGYINTDFPEDTTMHVDQFKMWDTDPGWL